MKVKESVNIIVCNSKIPHLKNVTEYRLILYDT